jgi:acyl-CoA-dependent ceramide synthase
MMAISVLLNKTKQNGTHQRRNINSTQHKPTLSSIKENEKQPNTSVDKPPKQQRSRTALYRCKHFATKHTWATPLALLLFILALYAVNPTESNILHHFIFLSYKQPPNAPNAKPQYGKGPWDLAFVTFYTVLLSFTREFIMQELLRPLARTHIKSRGKQARFMEQMYTAIYFGVLGPAGLYVMRQTPVWYFNTRGMYEGFPHRTHEAPFKFYYLFEAAYWAQQALVMLLGMEKPRKDFKELVMHHVVTLVLIGLSYRFHFAFLGIGVYVTHDISDFFLAVSLSWLGVFMRVSLVIWEFLLIFFTGLQVSSLYSPRFHDPVLCDFNRRVGVSAPCIESPHSILPSN